MRPVFSIAFDSSHCRWVSPSSLSSLICWNGRLSMRIQMVSLHGSGWDSSYQSIVRTSLLDTEHDRSFNVKEE